MAENDIYNSKKRYETIVKNVDNIHIKKKKKRQIYYCKNKENIPHFKKLLRYLESVDLSYTRRCRLYHTLMIVGYKTDKDFKDLDREDFDDVMIYAGKTFSPRTRSDFILDIKCIWRQLFPEKDERGRIDDTLHPYVVRHLKSRVDKSREKLRGDRFTPKEYKKLFDYFTKDVRIQCFLSLSIESYGRPQELLYLKIKNVELNGNYAKIWVSEHGKEGVKLLQCIESYPYLQTWLNKHPYKSDENAWLFVSLAKGWRGKQLNNTGINKLLRRACKKLKINKPITCYSLKRNGITWGRLRGDSDVEIQHRAGWSSTKQLSTYDMSNQEDAFKIQLAKKGILPKGQEKLYKSYLPKTKTCMYCEKINGFNDDECGNCKRPLDIEKLKEEYNQASKMTRVLEKFDERLKVIEEKNK